MQSNLEGAHSGASTAAQAAARTRTPDESHLNRLLTAVAAPIVRAVRSRRALLAAAAGAVLLVGVSPAEAARKTFEDKKRGFRMKVQDSLVQSPPKLTADEAYVVAEWYEDKAKYDSGFRPTFQVFWFATPKETAAGPSAPAAESGPHEMSEEEFMKAARAAFRVQSPDEAFDRQFSMEYYFGPTIPMAERWKTAEKGKTAGGHDFEYIEVNPPTKKRKKGEETPPAFGFAARLKLDRPKETVEVGFMGHCATEFVKDYRAEFALMVKSFDARIVGSDSQNTAAQQDLSQDKETRYKQILDSKLVKGWKADRTENYILVYHEEVDSGMVKSIGTQIEAIRAQIYEVMFPPDRPITAFSIVRVCKDQEQYMGYGAPGGSAGYWDANSEELVFYEDMSNKKDSLRVLYHEAFHQYIFYSVGDFAPHSWFNEGHGDYFAGHNYGAGKFTRDVFQWRVSTAKEWKRNPVRPPLKEWIEWTQGQYYGGNAQKIPGGANYALGWSLVYFLRTTKKPEYQGILDRYFNSLKGAVTRAREAESAWKKKLDDALAKGEPPPTRDETSDIGSRATWLKRAVEEAFRGVDWDQLEKDWLAADY